MQVYRIAKNEYIRDFNGTGAKLFGGRWNPKGIAILYTSENKALAAMEFLVHMQIKTVPHDLKFLTLDIPEKSVQIFDNKQFKNILKKDNAVFELQKEGKKWIKSQNSLALKVPTVLIPGEHNILINPMHKDFIKLKMIEIEDFSFDRRYFS